MKIILEQWRTFLKEQDDCRGENIGCGCVDSSGSNLTVADVQNFLASIYGSGEGSPLEKSFSGTYGSVGKGQADGICGKETRACIMKFQKDNGLCDDACVGPKTETKMREKSPDFFKKLSAEPKKPKTDTTTQTKNQKEEEKVSVSDLGVFDSGVTISVKSKIAGRPPHYKLAPNYHGYGKNTSKLDDASLINGVNFTSAITSANGLTARTWQTKKQWGNPVLRDVLIAAGQAVYNQVPKNTGLAQLGAVSYEKGGPAGHWGHMSGLECDIGFYSTLKRNGWIVGQTGGSRRKPKMSRYFDMKRNCIFLAAILSSPQVQAVLLEPGVITAMRAAAPMYGLDLSSSKLLNAKAYAPKNGGHNNHYHIRCDFPNRAVKHDGKDAKSGKDYKKASMKTALSSKVLEELKSKYKNKFSYTFGTIDGKIIDSYNETRSFYGASMNKTMAGLAQVLHYKNDKKNRLTEKELEYLLAYKASKNARGYQMANRVNRTLNKRYYGSKTRYKREGGSVGKMNHQQVANAINKVFKIKNSKFLYGGFGHNNQTTEDVFNFFATLGRMEKMRDKNLSGDKLTDEEIFYRDNKKEIDLIIDVQKRREYLGRWNRGLPTSKFNRWGKGGRAGGALNIAFIVNGTHVIVVYTQMNGTAFSGNHGSAHEEGFKLCNKILKHFSAQM